MRTSNYNDSSRIGGRYPKRQNSGSKSNSSNGTGGSGTRRPQGRRSNPHSGNGTINASGASAARNKYLELAKEALSNGNRVEAENFFQHAEHYSKVLSAVMDNRRERDENHTDSGHDRHNHHNQGQRTNDTTVSQEQVIPEPTAQTAPEEPSA